MGLFVLGLGIGNGPGFYLCLLIGFGLIILVCKDFSPRTNFEKSDFLGIELVIIPKL